MHMLIQCFVHLVHLHMGRLRNLDIHSAVDLAPSAQCVDTCVGQTAFHFFHKIRKRVGVLLQLVITCYGVVPLLHILRNLLGFAEVGCRVISDYSLDGNT